MINGYITIIKSQINSNLFFGFTVSGDTDMVTKWVLCFFEVSNPKVLYLAELNANEMAISDYKQQFSALKNRVMAETGKNNLVYSKFLREEGGNVKLGLKHFRKRKHKPAKKIYQCVYDKNKEAIALENISFKQFIELGGEINCIGNFEVNIEY